MGCYGSHILVEHITEQSLDGMYNDRFALGYTVVESILKNSIRVVYARFPKLHMYLHVPFQVYDIQQNVPKCAYCGYVSFCLI